MKSSHHVVEGNCLIKNEFKNMNYLPNKFSYRNNEVQVCKNDVCIKAKGQYAELISMAIFFALICTGISYLAKAIK